MERLRVRIVVSVFRDRLAMTTTTVAIVEDHEDAREIVRFYLEHHGCRVVTSDTGPGGIKLILDTRPDVALLDLDLPGCSGLEVARAVRMNPDTAHIPLVMWTANDIGPLRHKAAELNIITLLSKPCSPRDVLETLYAAAKKT